MVTSLRSNCSSIVVRISMASGQIPPNSRRSTTQHVGDTPTQFPCSSRRVRAQTSRPFGGGHQPILQGRRAIAKSGKCSLVRRRKSNLPSDLSKLCRPHLWLQRFRNDCRALYGAHHARCDAWCSDRFCRCCSLGTPVACRLIMAAYGYADERRSSLT